MWLQFCWLTFSHLLSGFWNVRAKLKISCNSKQWNWRSGSAAGGISSEWWDGFLQCWVQILIKEMNCCVGHLCCSSTFSVGDLCPTFSLFLLTFSFKERRIINVSVKWLDKETLNPYILCEENKKRSKVIIFSLVKYVWTWHLCKNWGCWFSRQCI